MKTFYEDWDKREAEHREQLERWVLAAMLIGGGFAVLIVLLWNAILPDSYRVFVTIGTGVLLELLGLGHLLWPVWRRARAR